MLSDHLGFENNSLIRYWFLQQTPQSARYVLVETPERMLVEMEISTSDVEEILPSTTDFFRDCPLPAQLSK